MRAFLCRIGLHSFFKQYDKWGTAYVCRYCLFSKTRRWKLSNWRDYE